MSDSASVSGRGSRDGCCWAASWGVGDGCDGAVSEHASEDGLPVGVLEMAVMGLSVSMPVKMNVVGLPVGVLETAVMWLSVSMPVGVLDGCDGAVSEHASEDGCCWAASGGVRDGCDGALSVKMNVVGLPGGVLEMAVMGLSSGLSLTMKLWVSVVIGVVREMSTWRRMRLNKMCMILSFWSQKPFSVSLEVLRFHLNCGSGISMKTRQLRNS